MQKRRLALFIAVPVTLLAVQLQANLVTNGDFETGDLTGWETWNGTNARTSADVAVESDAGNRFARLTIDDFKDYTYNSFLTQLVEVTPGQSYLVKFDTVATDLGGGWSAFFDGALVAQVEGYPAPTGPLSWTTYQLTVTPAHFEPGNVVPLMFDFYQNRGQLQIDNVSVSAVPDTTSGIINLALLLPFAIGAVTRHVRRARSA